MSSWGTYDNAANTPLWGTLMVNKVPTTANQTALYANTTANNWAVTLADGSVRNGYKTVGIFGVDKQEAAAYIGTTNSHAAHAGWVLRTTGQGGRAGRITNETLVAFSRIIGDGDGQTYANVSIVLTTSGNASVNTSAGYSNVAIFTVTPTLNGNTASTLTYLWQYNTGSAWASIPANTVPMQHSGATSAVLNARPGTGGTANNNTIYRVTVTAANQGVVAISSNVTISIPA
jgi:hypothetical protein